MRNQLEFPLVNGNKHDKSITDNNCKKTHNNLTI